MRWKPRRISPLEDERDQLRMDIIRLRHELETKQGAVGRLEVLVRQRSNRIDELNGKVEQLRHQNRQLDQENESLAELVRSSP